MVKSGTIILNTAARFLMPLQLMFSIFLLLRGHDEPGEGLLPAWSQQAPLRSICLPLALVPLKKCCGWSTPET
ncbi:hypothetical protein HORIV_45580 [Vreelandella olivaria]|uniref:Na+/H+ antiporter MnhB subunit-related protein domain-containing protein n=1 Tax=Vreelandella olivaria TaxID=390919 RepID=A0ABM7GN61_9GAMM|nr:hypothetical protein HORIV_45580 [Halomonas olivaria]